VDVSEPASISIGIAKRYATAVFELSKEANLSNLWKQMLMRWKAR
jgi:F0F1-type ATP synthase delta subunit